MHDTLHDFISSRKSLVWYVRDPYALSVEAIVEAILNYGNWRDVQKLITILGIHELARIFRTQIVRPRKNYRPEVVHYFTLYFDKYAR
jgi:hypothetical protein